jgi:hypothetical protein
MVRFARRREETAGVKSTRMSIAEHWGEFQEYFMELAGRYDATFSAVEAQRSSPA